MAHTKDGARPAANDLAEPVYAGECTLPTHAGRGDCPDTRHCASRPGLVLALGAWILYRCDKCGAVFTEGP